ncbi:MAG TPA: hypothetical protein VGH98_02045 [Gemmatimonadaceae bacterium]|jgi:photosystem II stability/assembly factor-like uncharacterized protein
MFRSPFLRWTFTAPLALAAIFIPKPASPPPVDPSFYAGLQWRNIGPLRGGRIAAVSGAVGEPGVFYVGLPAGGVWKTTSAGETWYPVFDSVKTVSSIGAIEVAPSDPNVIYAGTGDMVTGGAINEGDGVYKSTDAGRTWQHLGLDATKQIPSILVDPRDANLVMIAAQGNIHQRSDSRGVFRSTDGGRTWTKTLYVDDETGIQKLARAFDKPNVIFATTVRHYVAPGAPPRRGAEPDTGRTGTSLYKSVDEGVTWQEITGGGLPRLNGRTSVAVAMNTDAQRVFLIANSGFYRSDDGGGNWRQIAKEDERIRNGQGGYNCGVYVDPKSPDVVYTINTSSYKSTDGGNTFAGFKGAPGGDDPQQMWIDPTNGQRILLGLDQGGVVTLDGGMTWSSWYNQSTEQVYHISVDNSFPYWVYATQQDAGAIRTRARGNFGEITPFDWNSVSGWEWGTIVADPLNTNLVYASGSGIVKITYPSEQWINVSPATDPNLKLRTAFSQPIIFTPWNQHELLAGFQYLMATTDGGMHWRKISPDLGVPKGGEPTLAGRAATDNSTGRQPPLGGAIETISPSSVAAGTIWVGTSNGLVKLTRDEGKTWQDVTIPGLPNPTRANVSSIDASHNDAGEAYVAIEYHTTGDYAPYVYRTRDFGKTWTKIVDGLATDAPAGSFARVVRADTKKAGLLFAGTESAMYVSFDDGDHWQSLMLNLPTTSYRDIAIHDNDLVVGTYGRGIWVLDEYTVLRQLGPQVAGESTHLFKPADAIRVRRNVNADTPFPPEVPHATNPPDGAIIYYSLASRPANPISLDVFDASGKFVRHMSSVPTAQVKEASHPPEPNFWLASPMALSEATGINRANWDLRYDAPPAFSHSYEINANPGLTPPAPEGPMAPPGVYTIKLTVDGKSYTQTLTVHNDPRSPATAADVRAQHVLLQKIDDGLHETWNGYQQVAALRAALKSDVPASAPAEVAAAVSAFDAKLDSVGGNPEGRGFFRRGGRPAAASFVSVSGELVGQLNAQDNGDLAPTPGMLAAFSNACIDLKSADASWQNVTTRDLAALNAVLSKNGIREVQAPPSSSAGC